MKTVFISHSNKDRVFVKRLAEDLRRGGIRSWITDYEILPGDRIIDKITEGIAQCDYMIIVISENSIQSQWVSKEIGMAFSQRDASGSRRIIPLKIDKAPLPPELSAIFYIDFSKSYETALTALLSLLQQEVPQPDAKVAEFVDVDHLAAEVGKEAANYKGSGYSITTD